jgi:peroxiredoxin
MKSKIVLLILIIFLGTSMKTIQAQGYNIKLINPEYKDTLALIAYHYGDRKLVKDTIEIDQNGVIIYQGDEKLDGGIYLVVYPNNKYFEFIVTNDQEFEMSTKPEEYVKNMQITGSKENSLFYADMQFLMAKRDRYEQLDKRYREIESTKPDSAEIIKIEMMSIDSLVINNRTKIREENKNTFYSKFLYMLENPEIKEPLVLEDGTVDSTYPYRYYKAHFFDHVDFSDSSFLRTPVFHQKLEEYIENLTVKHPDSVIVACKYLIDKSKANQEIFQYTLAFLLNKYAKRKLMGFDAVYVYLAENYYMKPDITPWIDEASRKKITDDAIKMKPILIGKTAPNFTVYDRQGNPISLHDIKSKYLILYFWDSDCGHCQKETPKLHEHYAEWKKMGVEIFAVSIEYTHDRWEEFIDEHQLNNWINGIDDQQKSTFRVWYNIQSTPVVFVLDENKNIIAKRLAVEQIGDFLEFEINKDKE